MNFQFLKILQYMLLFLLLISNSDSFTFPKDSDVLIGHAFHFKNEKSLDLSEGSTCVLANGRQGICKKEIECPEKLKELIEGKRNHLSSDHCGFVHFNEIVCCPSKEIPNKLKTRIADRVCEEFEKAMKLEPTPTIFGGTAANANELPFMAALGYEKKDKLIKYNCGGTLISTTFVLTAGHCVLNIDNSKPVEVRLGSENLKDISDNVQIIPVDKIYPHPNFNIGTHYNDIALLKLKSPVRISDYTRPVCLQSKPILSVDTRNDFIIASGFGATSYENEGSDILMKTANLSFVKISQCNTKYRGLRKLPRGIDDSMLCYIDPNKSKRSDACQGDSGGPLVMINDLTDSIRLIGVTSFGEFCGGPVPGVYTAVYNYLDWIESIVWKN